MIFFFTVVSQFEPCLQSSVVSQFQPCPLRRTALFRDVFSFNGNNGNLAVHSNVSLLFFPNRAYRFPVQESKVFRQHKFVGVDFQLSSNFIEGCIWWHVHHSNSSNKFVLLMRAHRKKKDVHFPPFIYGMVDIGTGLVTGLVGTCDTACTCFVGRPSYSSICKRCETWHVAFFFKRLFSVSPICLIRWRIFCVPL